MFDLNVQGAWNSGYSGTGVRVVVVDDAFDYNHSDLSLNYDSLADWDFETASGDALGQTSESHGTAVMGLIGADNNGAGAVGIAYDSSLVGYSIYNFISDRWLENIRDAIYHGAMTAGGDVINLSLGMANTPLTAMGAFLNQSKVAEVRASIGTAVDNGRDGLGTIITKSAGNSRSTNFDVNADMWTNDTRQVVVAAVDQDGTISSYSSYGAANLVSAFGTPNDVITTDRVGDAGYNSTDFAFFNGTSAAAPMAAGVVSLILDANSSLGWRDVQCILASSARHVGSAVNGSTDGTEREPWGWNGADTWNGGGMHFSNDYGYGLVDATAAVRLAESWLLTGEAQTSANQSNTFEDGLDVSTLIPDGNSTGVTFNITEATSREVERVRLTINFSSEYIGDLEVYLISPEGTVSELLRDVVAGAVVQNYPSNGETYYPETASFNGSWVFESQEFRGELSNGTWQVRIVDDASGDAITVSDIDLETFGSFASSDDRYVFTDEYSSFASVGGHSTIVTDGNGGTDTVNAAAVSTASIITLVDGMWSMIDGTLLTLYNMENAIGSIGADSLIGNDDANRLWGMAGDDTLDGGWGYDTLNGGQGNDMADFTFFNGRTVADLFNQRVEFPDNTPGAYETLISIENVTTGSGDDQLIGSVGDNVLRGGGGNDWLDGNYGYDTLNGGSGTDTADYRFYSAATFVNLAAGRADFPNSTPGLYETLVSIENAITGAGDDSLVGNGGENWLSGEGGADTLDGGAGFDVLEGGDGNDVYVYHGHESITDTGVQVGDRINAQVSVNLRSFANIEHVTLQAFGANIDAFGNGANNSLVGNAGNNILAGGAGSDTLTGGHGLDWLDGGADSDALMGGEDNDTYVVRGHEAIAESGTTAGDKILAHVSVSLGSYAGIEDLELADDTGAIDGTGNGGSNTIRGNGHSNSLHGMGGADTLLGGGGVDRLDGGIGVDWLDGESGDDIYLYFGHETIAESGSDSGDRIYAQVGINLNAFLSIEHVSLQAFGADINAHGNASDNELVGNVGKNTLSGRDGNDTLLGGAGDDRLDGGAGTDRLEGGAGNDTYVLTAAGDTLVEQAEGGTDLVRASVTHTLGSEVENLLLTGSANRSGTGNTLANWLTGNGGNNTLSGLDGSDTLLGGGAADRLNGGAGSDRLVGEAGLDTLAGGLGNDIFVFSSRAEAGDVINDFRNLSGDNDRFELTASAFGTGLVAGTALTSAQFQVLQTGSVSATTASTSQVRFIWEQDDERLWSDTNGSGAGGLLLLADLQDGVSLGRGDLVLV